MGPRACVTWEGCLTHCILGCATQDGAPREKYRWLGYSDLLPYYLVCAHYWLYNFKDICLFLIEVCVCMHAACANEGQESSVPEPPVTCLTWVLGTHTLGFL